MWGFLSIAVCVGTFVYALYCTDPHSPGLFGKLRRLFFNSLPRSFKKYGRKILGERIMNIILGFLKYVFDSPNPIVQIFYMLLSFGGFSIFVVTGIMIHLPNQYVSKIHSYLVTLVSMVTFWSFFKLSFADPGIITRKNWKMVMDKYPYDEIIYKKDVNCRTCRFKKPARSKHCRFCDECIEKYDHHCIWINKCVGANNYRYFILFLFMQSMMCTYICILIYYIFKDQLEKFHIWESYYIDRKTKQHLKPTYTIVFQWLMSEYPALGFVFVLCLAMSVCLFCFALYHYSQVVTNRTTNEKIKISEWKDFYQNRKHNLQQILNQKQPLSAPPISKPKKKSRKSKSKPKSSQKYSDYSVEQLQKLIEECNHQITQLNKNIYTKSFIKTMREFLFNPNHAL